VLKFKTGLSGALPILLLGYLKKVKSKAKKSERSKIEQIENATTGWKASIVGLTFPNMPSQLRYMDPSEYQS
jgi:hypothetical protein